MVSLDQNGLIDVIVLVLQDIHHNIIVFCNISWMCTKYENNIKYMQYWCTQNYFYSHLDNMMLNEILIISHGDNWYFSDSNWICFELKIHEMVIEIKMKIITIISFSIDAICVSYIIISIFKFIFALINLMTIISDINMWLWQWSKFIHVLSTMVIESMMG